MSTVKLMVEGPNGVDVPAFSGTAYHTTTPSKVDGAAGAAEVDKRGITYIAAAIRCSRELVIAAAADLQTAGSTAAGASLAEGAADAIQVDVDDTIIYGQQPERAPIVNRDAASWTLTAGWTFAGTVASHTAGVTTLSQNVAATHAADPLILTRYHAVLFIISGYVSGSVTVKLGSASGSARSANGTYLEIIQAQSAVVSFTPSNDFVGSIDVANVWALPPSPPYKAGAWAVESYVKVVCTAAKAAPQTLINTVKVWAGWYRRAGAIEVV